MPIPASQIVTVNPRLLTPGGNDLEFNGLLLSASEVIPSSQMALPFPDADSVGKYFGLDSPEYQAAAIYFQGYNNSFTKPRAFYVGRRVTEDAAPFIRGGAFNALPSATLAALREIRDGGMSLMLGSYRGALGSVDFSGASSLSDVAQILQTALRKVDAGGEAWTNATVAYSSLFDAFTITGGAAGADEGVNYAEAPDITAIPAASASLTLGPVVLSELTSIRTGGFDIEVDGTNQVITGLDFTSCASLADVAGVLDSSLQMYGLSAALNSAGTAIVLSTLSTGSTATLSYGKPTTNSPSTDLVNRLKTTQADGAVLVTPGTDGHSGIFTELAAALRLTQSTAAVLSPGVDAMTPAENMEAILDLTENFVCFTTVTQPTQADALAFAQWATSKGVNYLYIYWDNDPALLQAGSSSTIAAALKQANVSATCGVWNNLDYAALIMGTAASIDWNRRNGTITFAFKAQEGVPANVTRGTDAVNLEAQGMNFMGDYATRNDQFIFLYPGQMFGSWKWIDTYLNAVWLNNALQVACMNGFEQTPRVPYNQEGYTLLKSWCLDPINRALYSGIIDTGVALSESQKAQLVREAGRDISQELTNDGYVLQVGYDPDDPSDDSAEAAARVNRESPEASLWYCYGGSVHRLNLASTVLA